MTEPRDCGKQKRHTRAKSRDFVCRSCLLQSRACVTPCDFLSSSFAPWPSVQNYNFAESTWSWISLVGSQHCCLSFSFYPVLVVAPFVLPRMNGLTQTSLLYWICHLLEWAKHYLNARSTSFFIYLFFFPRVFVFCLFVMKIVIVLTAVSFARCAPTFPNNVGSALGTLLLLGDNLCGSLVKILFHLKLSLMKHEGLNVDTV